MIIKNKMLLGVFLLVISVVWVVLVIVGLINILGIFKYELSSFIVDFKYFKLGDIVLEMYCIDEYNIKQWQLCNLFVFDVGMYWIYMGGVYVLISDIDGKIIKVYDGEIFYYC